MIGNKNKDVCFVPHNSTIVHFVNFVLTSPDGTDVNTSDLGSNCVSLHESMLHCVTVTSDSGSNVNG